MRKFIDSIMVTDYKLAHTIVEALEKDTYSVDFFDGNNRHGDTAIELKVYRNEKVVNTTPISLITEEKKV